MSQKDPKKRKTSLSVHLPTLFGVPSEPDQIYKTKEMLLHALKRHSATKLAGALRYADHRFSDITTEEIAASHFATQKVPQIVSKFESCAGDTTAKDIQQSILDEVIKFVMSTTEGESVAVGAVFAHPHKTSNPASVVLPPKHKSSNLMHVDEDETAPLAGLNDASKRALRWLPWAKKEQNPNRRNSKARRDLEEGQSSFPSTKVPLVALSTPLLIPERLWDVQIAIESILRELEESEQMDITGAWSARVFLVNALTFALEMLFNGFFVPGVAIVELGVADHTPIVHETKHLPVVNFLPLDVLLKVATGSVPNSALLRAARLLVGYSQSWVCAVRKRTVFISTEQERAITNIGCVGRCLLLDSNNIAPIRDAAASEWHVIQTSQGLRVVSSDTLEGKEERARHNVYKTHCPLKGYPSTWWLVCMLVLSWCIALLYIMFPGYSLRTLAFPTATVIPMCLADEFGIISWAISGDFDTKLCPLLWFTRHHIRLEANEKTVYDLRPPFVLILRAKFLLRGLPLMWSLLLLWGGWTNNLTSPRAREISDIFNCIVAVACSIFLLVLWPLWGDAFSRCRVSSGVTAFVGRSETDMAPPRRFFRWFESHGQFSVFPTTTAVLVFPKESRFVR